MPAGEGRVTEFPVLHSLDHVIVGVGDLDAAVADHAALLDRAPSWRGEHPGQGTANALFRLDNTYLELLSPSGDGPVGDALRAHLERSGDGVFGLAFGCDDADEVHASWSASGLEPAEPQSGSGVDAESGAERSWRNVFLPPATTRGVVLFAIEHESPPESLPAVAPNDAQAAVTGLDHVVVNTADGDAAISLYRDGLGLRLALDRAFEQWGSRLLFFRVGGISVEVAQSLGEPSTDDDPDRFWGLAWRVVDAEAARARLDAAGFDTSEVRPGRKDGTRVLTVRDRTGGVPTLLVEPTR